jgi:sphingosine kinase
MTSSVSISILQLETEYPDYIEDWGKDLDNEDKQYTEFVTIAGDGTINQLLNGFFKNKDKDALLDMPIGLLPGGSYNAMACDLHGRVINHAATNVLRGTTIDVDIM